MWIFAGTLTYILYLLVCIARYAIFYLTENVQVASFSQLLYTMQVSMGGAENTIMQILGGFFSQYWLQLILSTVIYISFLLLVRKEKREQGTILRRAVICCGCAACASTLFLSGALGARMFDAYNVLGIGKYLDERDRISTLYEKYYQMPDEAGLSYPEKKKNLIWIFCESMESTYADRRNGGTMDESLIPNLTKIASENQDFSGGEPLGGAYVTNATSWTVAGLVAQTSGTPLSAGNGEFTKDFESSASFLPSVESLGQILETQGYRNYAMFGSEAAYGGRANYFSQHGDYEIFDLQTARDEGKIPQNYKEWWGFEDKKLFEYAKEKITMLAELGEPFNFNMLTADTHFKDGYKCPDCPDTFDEQMENVISCSDKRISDFVSWIQRQDFYQDTVIVISGDHLNMDGLIPTLVDEDYGRKTYFTVINGPVLDDQEARRFCTLDIFPTVTEALGIKIPEGRLGLGTSLYSGKPTLIEEMGFDSFNDQIAYKSNFYNDVILSNDEAGKKLVSDAEKAEAARSRKSEWQSASSNPEEEKE